MSRIYERGQLADYTPLILPPSPWVRMPVEVKPAPPRRTKPRKPSKYGFDTQEIGTSVVIPHGVVQRHVMRARIAALIFKRHQHWPQRFLVTIAPDGIKVTRTK